MINNELCYKPGYQVQARPNYRGMVDVNIDLYTHDSGTPGYRERILAGGSYEIDCSGSRLEVMKRLLDKFMEIEEHEWREFLRDKRTFVAPFHPHRYDGNARWEAA